MAAVLSSDMDKTDKVVTMIAECRDMKLAILPPDINRCEYHFNPLQADEVARIAAESSPSSSGKGKEEEGISGAVLYGLGAIKGLGQGAIEAILETRTNDGQFKDLFDLCQREEVLE